jgi:hypothetical protein
MRSKTYILVVIAVVAVGIACFSVNAMANRGHGALGEIYVTSQGLYYDTFVSAETLPPHGRFQILEDGMTEFGPGDPGYLGGRWYIPSTGEHLLCPLLPPGRPEPRPEQ